MTGSTLLLWTESSQKPLLKTFFYNNNGTREVKIFQTLLKKDILQQTFQIYISWPNLMDGRKPYDIGKKIFDWLVYQTLFYYGCIFSVWYKFIHFPPLKPCNI